MTGLFDENDDQATLIEKTNTALKAAGVKEPDEDSEPEFTEEDLAIAEKIFFKGYAEKEYEHPLVKGFKAKISTLMPAEYDMIDSALLNFVEARRDGDNSMVTDVIISAKRSNFTLALCLVSLNGQELLEEPVKRIKNLKNVVKQYERDLTSGDITEAQKTLSNAIAMITERAAKISTELNGNVIDWINDKRREFEGVVSSIVSRDGVVVKF